MNQKEKETQPYGSLAWALGTSRSSTMMPGAAQAAWLLSVRVIRTWRRPGNGLAAFKDLAVMLKMTCPDLLDIITPPPTHMAAIKAGISQGVRAIICQNRFARHLKRLRRQPGLQKRPG